MKALSMALACAACLFAGGLDEYKTVYVLPMSGGLDQFLAIKLTSGAVLQVVTDPQKADLILTDRIGAAFEEQLNDLYKRDTSDDKDKDKDKAAPTDPWAAPRAISSPISHNRGTIFLVDRKTRDVVWTVYVKPKGSTADDVNHVAAAVVSKLEKDRKTAAK